jgi:hypothetical protein
MKEVGGASSSNGSQGYFSSDSVQLMQQQGVWPKRTDALSRQRSLSGSSASSSANSSPRSSSTGPTLITPLDAWKAGASSNIGRINKMGQGTAAIQHNNMVYNPVELKWVGNEDEVAIDHWDDMILDELEPEKSSALAMDDAIFQMDSRYSAKLRDAVSSMNEQYSRQNTRGSNASVGRRDPALLIRDFAVDALVAMARKSHLPSNGTPSAGRSMQPLPFPHLTSPRGASASLPVPTGTSPRANIIPSKRSAVREEFKETEDDADFMDIDLDESKLKSAPLLAADGPKEAPNLKGLLGSVTIDDDLEI